jgi:hypothetical protein
VSLSEEGKRAMDAHIVLQAPGGSTAADGDATAIWTSGEEVACAEGEEEPCWSYVVQAAGYDPDGLPAVEVQAPVEATVGEEVEVSTPTEGLYAPTIDFGDGEEAAGVMAMHVYDAPGEYELTAAGAEELGYRVSAQRTIKIVPGGPEEEGPGEEPAPEAEKEPGPGTGGGLGDGDKSSSAGGSASSTPPPSQGSPPPAEDACAAAQAARAQAARALKKAKLKLAGASGPKARKHLAAAKHRRAVALQRAQGRLAAAC